jgi:hypothetical protein
MKPVEGGVVISAIKRVVSEVKKHYPISLRARRWG